MTALRPARPTDAGQVGAILSAFIDDTPWMPRVHTRAEDLSFAGDMIERGWVTVAENDGVTGFLAREDGMIHALYVAADQRGQGMGTALIGAAQEAAETLTLWTFQANRRAQDFYEKHGFRQVERTDGQGNDEGLPDIRYLWERNAS